MLTLISCVRTDYQQVDKAGKHTDATKAQASKVQVQAREVTNVANGAAQASERQQAAFVKAKAKAEEAKKAGEKAKAAFRCGVFFLFVPSFIGFFVVFPTGLHPPLRLLARRPDRGHTGVVWCCVVLRDVALCNLVA